MCANNIADGYNVSLQGFLFRKLFLNEKKDRFIET